MSLQPVAVIMGGPSMEHDISVQSGQAMLQNLDPKKYQPIKVLINKKGQWLWGPKSEPLNLVESMQKMNRQKMVALIGLHGSYGEDGTLQAILQNYGVAYTGSRVGASLMAMDKTTSNSVYAGNGLTIPRSLFFANRKEADEQKIVSQLGLPLVVKPARQGSSVGVHLVKEPAQLGSALDDAFSYDQQIVVQQYIKGREFSCGVLQIGQEFKALPPTEIIPVSSDFFDFEAKYTDGGSQEVTPAMVPAEITAQIQQIARQAHQMLGCSTYSRTDMILADQKLYVIETNTLPGMTSHSIFPQQAKAAGINMSQLLDYLVAGARRGV
jgi:D-alanine-D-alanine ligase